MANRSSDSYTTIQTATADDYLGPFGGRFFGSGYKRVRQDISIGPMFAGSFAGELSLTMPDQWSTKGAARQLPHASSIDIIVAAALLGEHSARLRKVEGPCWTEELTIRAPVAPEEGAAINLAVSGESHVAGDDRTITTADIGGFKAQITVAHHATNSEEIANTESEANRPVTTAPHPYVDGFRHHINTVSNLEIDFDGNNATSQLLTERDTENTAVVGVDASPGVASVHLIDAFCEALQVGQILLYDLDNLQRATSNTLWMRRLRIRAQAPEFRVPNVKSVTDLQKLSLVAIQKETWRTADIRYRRPGIELTCSVAHKIAQGGGYDQIG
ncbi:hypothetical protein ABH922_005323 [Rhodococcus sp. 27YEA15]|uniref:AvrD family protein n=1 Tax=Rhodococcus sp. 27YEA15 TaxID=3156259 RepID=UPI003C7B1499